MPEQHPIEGLIKSAMESIKEMADVNTVVGEPVEAPDGSVIIPISKVVCGFGAGGGEFEPPGEQANGGNEVPVPFFGGGSGAGISVQPVGFLVVGNGQVRLLPVRGNTTVERIIDLAPQVMSQLQAMLGRMGNKERNKENVAEDDTSPQQPTAPI